MSAIARSTKMKAMRVRCECPIKTERTETTWGAVLKSQVTALMWCEAEDCYTHVAPETENARLPTVKRWMHSTAKWWEEDDCSRYLDIMSVTRVKQHDECCIWAAHNTSETV